LSLVVDVHTHMLSEQWIAMLVEHGAPLYRLVQRGDRKTLFMGPAAIMTPNQGMFDYEMRIAAMDEAGVDIAIISLTCPNVYWGGAEISARAAVQINDDMAQAQQKYPQRIRWLASLPWQYPDRALAELQRSRERGAVGVMVMADIDGVALTDPKFAPIWQAIDDAALPVLVHPTVPPAGDVLGLDELGLANPLGFTFNTSLAVARMILAGFFERHTKLKLIASHAGGSLPFLIGRLDRCWEKIEPTRAKTSHPPSYYFKRVYLDSVVYRLDALEMAIDTAGLDNVLYGSDYPFNIGDMPGILALVDRLPDESREKVRSANAARIFDLS
jgi:aminocarboxymuconate-semialdehyde decarboxylase